LAEAGFASETNRASHRIFTATQNLEAWRLLASGERLYVTCNCVLLGKHTTSRMLEGESPSMHSHSLRIKIIISFGRPTGLARLNL
jgi:hypothetical protein